MAHRMYRPPLPTLLPFRAEDNDAAFSVKNTFIDAAIPRSPSLAPFYRERCSRSCPAKYDGGRLPAFSDVVNTSETCVFPGDSELHSPRATRTPSGHSFADASSSSSSSQPPPLWTDTLSSAASDVTADVGLPEADASFQAADPRLQQWSAAFMVFQGAFAVEFSGLDAGSGSSGPLNVGSRAHARGRCKPCVFFHTKGCSTGVACVFCHLCEAGEKTKRRKEKREKISKWREAQNFVHNQRPRPAKVAEAEPLPVGVVCRLSS